MDEGIAEASPTDPHSILAFWRSFDFPAKRIAWDKTCTEMREQKTSSINGRKRLNEMTKAFRARTKEEQVLNMAELLKAYQEEIDQLSRRCKVGESAYFAIYKLLYEAPDPHPALDNLMNNVLTGSTHALEIERLKAELAQYDEEFQQLKNQDITIRRLEDQIAEFRASIEEQVSSEVQRRVQAVEEQAQERVLEAQELQRSAEKRYQMALDSVKQAQMVADRAQSQLFETSSGLEEKLSRLEKENALLAEAVQRLQLQLAETESHLQSRQKQSAEKEGRQSSAAYEHLVAQLTEQLRVVEGQARVDKTAAEKQLREMQALYVAESEKLASLREEMARQWVRREELARARKELSLLKKMCFHRSDNDEEDEQISSSSSRDNEPERALEGEQEGRLEEMLVRKIQTLEAELAQLRASLSESRQQESTQRDSISSLRVSLESSSQLIERLERELEQRSAALEQLLSQPQPSSRKGDMEDLATLLDVQMPNSKGQSSSSGKDQANVQMISWLQSQRDRYKDKLSHCEAEVMALQQQLSSLQTKYSLIETDNVQLYSRIKFLQLYQSKSAGRMEEGRYGDEEVEMKYQSLYEQRMNPFAEFAQLERQRKLRELSVADRIVLNTTLAIVSNHAGRKMCMVLSFLLVYLGSMHLLVFFTIYYAAHSHCVDHH